MTIGSNLSIKSEACTGQLQDLCWGFFLEGQDVKELVAREGLCSLQAYKEGPN